MLILIEEAEHPILKRDGNNLFVDQYISVTDAALGTHIEVPTIEGKAKIKIEPGTQPGKVLRLRGKGIPALRGGGVGDLYCHLVVEIPVGLTTKQKELVRELETSLQEDGARHYLKGRSWFENVKKFFGDKSN